MPRYYNNSGDTSLGLSNAVGGFLDAYMSQKQRKEDERQQLIIEALRQQQFEESQAGNLFKREQDARDRLAPTLKGSPTAGYKNIYPNQTNVAGQQIKGMVQDVTGPFQEPSTQEPSVSAQLKELVDKAILERAQSDPAFLNDYVNKKAFGKGVGGERSEKPTGIGNFKSVVLNRQKQADEARNAALWQIFNSFPELFFDKDKTTESGYAENPREEFIDYTPEQLVEYVKQQEPETIEEKHWFSPNETLPNPEREKAIQTLSGIDVPPSYQIPVGEEARGLQDSVNIGQRDAGMAGALMRTNMGIPPAQQGAAPIQQGQQGGQGEETIAQATAELKAEGYTDEQIQQALIKMGLIQ